MKYPKTFVFLLAGACFLGTACGGNTESKSTETTTEAPPKEAVAEFQNLNKGPWKDMQSKKNGAVIDVRTSGEVESGMIDGAKHIDWNGDDFVGKVKATYPDKKTPLFIYCHAGGRSARASEALIKEGYQEVYNLLGGYSQWSE